MDVKAVFAPRSPERERRTNGATLRPPARSGEELHDNPSLLLPLLFLAGRAMHLGSELAVVIHIYVELMEKFSIRGLILS